MLTGGVYLKKRVQHPKINECRDRGTPYWFFRYWADELRPDGTIKTSRKRHIIGPSKSADAITKKQAEIERDQFLASLNAAPSACQAAAEAAEPADIGAILFGKLAEMWRTDFVERKIGPRALIAKPTKAKYIIQLENHIMPRWKDTRLSQFRAKDVLDWLQGECQSWHMMADLRNIMSGIFAKAQEWEILPDSYANPMRRVKLPRKWEVRKKDILSEEQTESVLKRLSDPQLLICETCLDTGTRISEVTGLRIRNVNIEAGSIRIEQRNWRGDIDEPKTAKSRRTLALGTLSDRYRVWTASLKNRSPEAWVFPQRDDPEQPVWDSGVRKALKLAAEAEGCDFPGFGPHSLRRANITRRQEVGGSSIETSQIAGHSNTRITEEYTVVQLRRQDELTRRIQSRRVKAGKRNKAKLVEITRPDAAA
jgi:integrase